MTPQQIKQTRLSLGYSLTEWANALGFDRKNAKVTAWRWEKGTRKPSRQTIMVMEQYVNGVRK